MKNNLLIVGGTSGIMNSCLKSFLKKKYKIFATYSNEKNLKNISIDLRRSKNIKFIKLNLNDKDEEILETLKAKDISIAVISNKRHPFTVQSVDEYFAKYIDVTIGSGSDYPLKPDPVSAQFVLSKFNCDPTNSYFVGDTGYDINTAKNAGMISIGVLWGMSDKEKLSAFEPDHLFEKSEDLLEFFKSI